MTLAPWRSGEHLTARSQHVELAHGVIYEMKEWFKSIDPRILFGFAVLSVVCLLAVVIALGKVHQESSFGLDVVLGCLTTMAGGFTVWAFSNMKDKS